MYLNSRWLSAILPLTLSALSCTLSAHWSDFGRGVVNGRATESRKIDRSTQRKIDRESRVALKIGRALDVSGTDFYSVEQSIRAWVKANGCAEKPKTEELPDKAEDGTTVTRKTHGRGKEGSEVVLITV